MVCLTVTSVTTETKIRGGEETSFGGTKDYNNNKRGTETRRNSEAEIPH
jgi:hypothetical protein